VKRIRLYLSLSGVVAVLAAILLVPLPHNVICTLEIQPRNAALVNVNVGGELAEIRVEPDQQVAEGQLLARLTNIELDLQIADLAGQADRYRRQLDNLTVQRHRDPQAGAEIPAIREVLETVVDQLARRREDLDRLELSAPVAGTIFPPDWIPEPQEMEDELPGWSGTPLDRENLGCYLEVGQVFCQVGDPTRMEARLVIDQADIEFVHPGLPVEIRLESLPEEVLTHNPGDQGDVELTIEKVSPSKMTESPTRLSAKAGGELATHTDATGRERPLDASYLAVVPLDNPAGEFLPGLRGRAKIKVGSQPLGARLYRWLAQTINFDL
jgi:putative peptide zinc metalloprotease protein